jgi:hypothetical protein
MMLTLDEALPVIKEAMSSGTILVGGQAINLWATLLDIKLSKPSFTRDIDFIGDGSDARRANQRISIPHELKLANQDDSSINAAVIIVRFPQHDADTPIDFLMTLYGLDRAVLEKSAVEIEVDHFLIKVIHPVLLMQSKLHNFGLPSKRTDEGFEQARISIEIVHAFIATAMHNPEVEIKDILKMIRDIFYFAKSDAGIDAFNEYHFDCLASLPIAEMQTSANDKIQNFLNKGFLTNTRQVTTFRQRKANLKKMSVNTNST